MPLSAEDVARGVALIDDGRSIRYAANAIGVPYETLRDAVRRFRETGSYNRRPGSGRPRVTEPRDDRFLTLRILRNRHLTVVQAIHQLEEVRGVQISERTARRRLNEYGLMAFRPVRGPELTRTHRVTRLAFAREHSHWTMDEWSAVLFTDESRFALRSPDGRERVWRRRNERYAACNFSQSQPFQRGSLMVWAGISMERRTELVVVRGGSLTAIRYVDEILEPHVLPILNEIGDRSILMHAHMSPA